MSGPETHVSERLDALLAELPDDAWTISHDEDTEWKVATIVIDWRRVPGEAMPGERARLRLVDPPGTPEGNQS